MLPIPSDIDMDIVSSRKMPSFASTDEVSIALAIACVLCTCSLILSVLDVRFRLNDLSKL